MVNQEKEAGRPGRPSASVAQRLLAVTGQIVFFVAVWLVANFVGRKLGGKVPGSVLGMVGVLLLLGWGMVKPKHIEQGAQLLLAEMLLFFIPAFVGLVNYSGLLGIQGLRLLATIAIGTLIVMAGTVWVVDRVFQWESRRNQARASQA